MKESTNLNRYVALMFLQNFQKYSSPIASITEQTKI